MSSTIKEIETSPEKGRSRESSLYATALLGKELSGPVAQGLSAVFYVNWSKHLIGALAVDFDGDVHCKSAGLNALVLDNKFRKLIPPLQDILARGLVSPRQTCKI
jgi:hypothetical protein